MGFMDKVRSMASAVTGGSAKVELTILQPTRQGPFSVKVDAVVGKNDVKIDKVYLKLAGEEMVTVEVEKPKQGGGTEKTNVSETNYTYQQEIKVADGQTLTTNQSYSWDAQVQLPADAKPTYKGVKASHSWKLLAGLSTFGNDPDSGWKTLEV
jgi:hypothetical protein